MQSGGFEIGQGAELIPLCWRLAADSVGYMLAAGAPALIACVLVVRSLQHGKDAAGCIRFLESRALTLVGVIFLAWVPWYPVVAGSTAPVPVAPAWHLLLRTTEAVNQLIDQGLKSDETLQKRAAALATADLEKNPELAGEYGNFEQQCYLPARHKAAKLGLPEGFAAWAGSENLTETPGFYAPCGSNTSSACKTGFLSSLQPILQGKGKSSASCNQWWQGGESGQGLKERLLGALRKDAAPIWDGNLSKNDAKAWLRSYLLRSDSRLNFVSGLWDKAQNLLKQLGGLKQLGAASLSRLGSAALVWKLGSEGVLLLYLLLGLMPQIQILLLSLLALLWPAIAMLSGFSTRVLVRCALAYALIKLWTALRTVGSFMHEVVWKLAAGPDSGIAALALNFTDARQLLLWYLAASLPWIVPLLGSWLMWKFVRNVSAPN